MSNTEVLKIILKHHTDKLSASASSFKEDFDDGFMDAGLKEAYMKQDAEITRKIESLTAAISMMEGWISVEDRLPEDNDYYNVVVPDGYSTCASFNPRDQRWTALTEEDEHANYCSEVMKVILWQSIPQPPEADQ